MRIRMRLAAQYRASAPGVRWRRRGGHRTAAIMWNPRQGAADMAKGNPLQEQLLKAGLVKKSKVSAVAREQHVARHARAASGPNEIELEAQRVRAEKAERDRALEAGRRAQVRERELQAQARQIIRDKRVPHGGESEYRFNAAGAIRTLLVT